MEAEIKEIKRENQYSIVQVKVVNRGTYAGIIMYQNCCFSKIAKARGYRYFISMEEKKIAGCKDCEWHDEYSLHFSNSKDDLLELSSKDKFKNAEDIIDINELSMVCGYLPIPSSHFLHAVYFNDLNAVEDLLEKDKSLLAEKDEHGFQAMHIAAFEGHSDIVRTLVHAGADINCKGMWGWTPLHMAVKSHQAHMAELLIHLNADPAAKMDSGNTPLHAAAYQGSVEMAALLIEVGVGVEVEDMEGNTPLHAAASRNHLEVVKFLISKGANPEKENKLGQTPLFFAKSHNHEQTIDFLTGYE